MKNHKSVLLLHGWAANAAVFDDLRGRLPEYAFSAPDLPGHGTADFGGAFDADTVCRTLAQSIDTPVHLFGWSLGGLLALQIAADYPDKIQTVAVCAGFARYAAAPDYPQGGHRENLEKLSAAFEQDFPAQMRRFIELQSLYTPQAQPLFQAALAKLVQYGIPAGLRAAQDAIAAADIRGKLAEISCPTLLLYGRKDRMTPPAAGEYLHEKIKHSQLIFFEKSAHMPFLSEAEKFSAALRSFWRETA